LKILYIHPYAYWANSHLLLNFLRISNYLNSRKNMLKCPIEERYLDLRHEDLPNFSPNRIDVYRKVLQTLLLDIYTKFKFNIIAISCYTSFNYLNTVEVAFLAKKNFPNCIIVVGGVHPTIIPDDFQIGNFPELLYEVYSRNETPFDYLIKEEGEIPFFNLLAGLIDNSIKKRNNANEPCIILKPELIEDLDELPLINLDLYKSYRKSINKLYIDFSRGCIYRCSYCGTSGKISCYKKIRTRQIRNCIKELEIINNLSWLSINQIHISDMFFLPKRSKREEFFIELKKLISKEGKFPFKIIVYDRIEFCSLKDLKNYKDLDIIPHFGFDFSSEEMLYKMDKFYGKSKEIIYNSIKNYLEKATALIIESNRIGSKIVFYYMIGTPGEDHFTLLQGKRFFLEKRFNDHSLVEKYNINLDFSKYMAFIGSNLYEKAEKKFGAKIYYKNWWKIFHEKQPIYGLLVKPSRNLSLIECIDLSYNYMKEILKYQLKRKNKFYSFQLIIFWKDMLKQILNLYQHNIKN